MNCVFCSIINNQIPADKVYEDEYAVAFRDINPLAKTHIVVVPRDCRLHFHNLEDDKMAKLMSAIKNIISEQNIKDGYRLVCNNGSDGGQSVNHVHFHILAGEPLGHNLAGR